MATLENRGDGCWRVTVSAGYDAAGRQRRIRRTIHTNPQSTLLAQRREAERIAAQIQTDAGRGLLSVAPAITLDQLFDEFINAKHLQPTTRKHYEDLYKRAIGPALGNTPVRDITPRAIARFYRELAQMPALTARSSTGKLSGTTQKKFATLLRNLLSYAVRMQYITVNPAAAAIPPLEDSAEKKIWEPQTIILFLEYLKNEDLQWQTYFTLAVVTGARPGELTAADWTDIIDGHALRIAASAARINGETVRQSRPKTRASERLIDLPKEVIDLLEQWRFSQQMQAACLGEWHTDAIFTTAAGKRIDLGTPTHKFQKLIRKYDLPKITLHDLRHSCASMLIAEGLDVRTVAARLGHSQTSTTLDIYSHAFQSANSAATNAITHALDSARKALEKGE